MIFLWSLDQNLQTMFALQDSVSLCFYLPLCLISHDWPFRENDKTLPLISSAARVLVFPTVFPFMLFSCCLHSLVLISCSNVAESLSILTCVLVSMWPPSFNEYDIYLLQHTVVIHSCNIPQPAQSSATDMSSRMNAWHTETFLLCADQGNNL